MISKLLSYLKYTMKLHDLKMFSFQLIKVFIALPLYNIYVIVIFKIGIILFYSVLARQSEK